MAIAATARPMIAPGLVLHALKRTLQIIHCWDRTEQEFERQRTAVAFMADIDLRDVRVKYWVVWKEEGTQWNG